MKDEDWIFFVWYLLVAIGMVGSCLLFFFWG